MDLKEFNKEISEVFVTGINILNKARALKDVSNELQLLAYNGVVLASKISSDQGKSLITLSRFLSELPDQIGPELMELEKRASILACNLTNCTLEIKKLYQYVLAIEKWYNMNFQKFNKNFALKKSNGKLSIDINELNQIFSDSNTNKSEKNNIEIISKKIDDLWEQVEIYLSEIRNSFNLTENTLERIKRNGFIAEFMSSNILIESANLNSEKSNFISFVENINNIIKKLYESLENINTKIYSGKNSLSLIKKTYEK